MANYTFKGDINDPSILWDKIQSGLSQNVIIKSIKDKKPYTVNYVTADEISFTAESRNGGLP